MSIGKAARPGALVRSEHVARQTLMAYAIRLALPFLASATLPAGPAAAQAPANTARDYDIPAGPLSSSLARFAGETGVPLSANAALTAGKQAPALKGRFTVREALDRLLAGSGLEASQQDGAVVVRPASQPAAEAVPETALGEVKVKAAREGRFGDAPPERGGFNAEYQSSSTKTPLELRETPQSITVVTRDSLDARQVNDINSALELTAGVTYAGRAFAGLSPRTGESLMMRGQSLDGARDIRIDGFAAGSDRNNIDLAAFERVEAVKGPSSMLYGQGSLGGFINLVRRKPQAESAASVVAQAGSWDTYRTEMDVTGAVNKDRNVLGRLTAAYEDSGSFIDGVHSRRSVLAPGVEARFDNRTRALLQFIYQDDEFTPTLGIPLKQVGSQLRAPNIPRSFFFGLPSTEKSTADALHTTLRVDHELSDRWLATLHLSNSRNKLRGIMDAYGYGIDAAGNTNLYSSFVQHEQKNWAGELRLDGKFNAFGREHRLLTGLERNRLDFKAWGGGGYTVVGTGNIYSGIFTGRFPGGSNPVTFNGRDSGDTEAAYAQVMFSVLDRTRLLLGARYDRTSQESTFTNAGGSSIETANNSAWTGRIGVTQDLTRNVTAYATYAESFNPVFDESRTGAILEPETGTGYEVGLKSEWFNKRLAATLAAYRQDLDNRPIPDPANGPGQNFSISAGLQRTKGVELEVSGSPQPGLTVGFAGTRLDSKYVDPLDPNFGLKTDGSAARQASFFASYELQEGDFRGLGMAFTVVSMGDREVISGTRNLTIEGYERIDLGVFYNGLPGWRLALQIRNLTDRTYIEQPNSSFAYAHFFGAPRAALFRAEYRFK